MAERNNVIIEIYGKYREYFWFRFHICWYLSDWTLCVDFVAERELEHELYHTNISELSSLRVIPNFHSYFLSVPFTTPSFPLNVKLYSFYLPSCAVALGYLQLPSVMNLRR